MGRPYQSFFVNNAQPATSSNPIGATQPGPTITSLGWPKGDVTYSDICIRLSGNLNLSTSSAGTVVAGGGLVHLRSLFFSTDKHGYIIEGLDGVMLNRIQQVRQRCSDQVVTDVSAATTGTPTFDYALRLPICMDRDQARPEDTVLDMWNAAPTLTTQFGIATDFISGGTYTTETVQVLNQEVHAYINPGPVDAAADGPIVMPHLGIVKFPVSATVKQQQIILPYGDRNIKRLYIAQRNGSTYAELANTVVGANDLDRLSVKVNGFPWFNNVEWLALQDENKGAFKLRTAITGMAVVDFAPVRAQGFKLSDALSVVSQQQGTIELDIDVTSVSNGQLWIGIESVKPIPPAALRPAPAATAQA